MASTLKSKVVLYNFIPFHMYKVKQFTENDSINYIQLVGNNLIWWLAEIIKASDVLGMICQYFCKFSIFIYLKIKIFTWLENVERGIKYFKNLLGSVSTVYNQWHQMAKV